MSHEYLMVFLSACGYDCWHEDRSSRRVTECVIRQLFGHNETLC